MLFDYLYIFSIFAAVHQHRNKHFVTLSHQQLDHRPNTGPGQTQGTAKVPTRTCIGCRNHDQQSSLVRFVCDESGPVPQVIPDLARRLDGRGAWMHRQKSCYKAGRKSFNRALRIRSELDISLVTSLFDASAQT